MSGAFRAYVIMTVMLATTVIAGCHSEPASETPATLRTGPWHADITLPGGESRFGMEIARDNEQWVVTLINGSERIRVPSVTFDQGRLTLRFPAFNNRIDAQLNEGALEGALTLVKRYGETQVIPFSAKPGARPQPQPMVQAASDLSGRWQVEFTEEDGTTYPAVGEFSQRGNRLLGTFLTETGDYRFLGGSVNGNGMSLSTFDGAHAFLFTASIEQNGALRGQFWSGNKSVERWVATRNERAALKDPASLTFLKPDYERFTFSFPDLSGNTVSLDDPQFDGKVVVVTLAGSWCPNCHDEAALMREFYTRYQSKGVEIVALMYEHFEDQDTARAQVTRFREKFDIRYTTLLAGISEKTEAAATLPALSHVLAFPTTLFIDRSGKVREIHTGFSGPGTGEHHEKMKRTMVTLLDTLVAEPAPAPESELAPESAPEPEDSSAATDLSAG